jgi:hypothetical protein
VTLLLFLLMMIMLLLLLMMMMIKILKKEACLFVCFLGVTTHRGCIFTAR